MQVEKKIPLIKPYITQEVKDKVCEVLESGYLTEGPVTSELEDLFADYVGARRAIAVTSCTTGLETALRALGIGPGDEVIVPDYTYPATADAVAIVGANIVIVDVCRENMLIDYDKIEEAVSKRTRVLMPVSLFGNPLNYDRLNEIKKKYNLFIIEDAACSLGAEFNGTRVGNLADITVFSLHPRKFITTGEGGMITTNNSDWADWILSYKHFGMDEGRSRSTTCFERIGTNYKLSNVLAAIGLVQMNHIDSLMNKRARLAEHYRELLTDSLEVTFPSMTSKGVHSWQSFCVFVDDRDDIVRRLSERGIETQIGTYSLHMHRAFAKSERCKITGEMPNSRHAFEQCLTLPMYHDMTEGEQEYVVRQLLKLKAQSSKLKAES
ncbi:MAG: DegT/DnrJ/EryC1/StrS family aminotransferase [Desulfatiglans sp.]|nr:DegT/DnrJ/EryC1/StrS family aminotransferase [Desulfatiglans sp.]